MAEAAELPFSCWVATSGVDPASSESFGGELDGGGGDVCGGQKRGASVKGGILNDVEEEVMSRLDSMQGCHTCVLLAGTFFTPLAFAGTSLPLLARSNRARSIKAAYQHFHISQSELTNTCFFTFKQLFIVISCIILCVHL